MFIKSEPFMWRQRMGHLLLDKKKSK